MTEFNINDLVEIGRKWFMDNKAHKGKIVKISADGSRLEIESGTYPKRFSISKMNCKRVNQLKQVEA